MPHSQTVYSPTAIAISDSCLVLWLTMCPETLLHCVTSRVLALQASAPLGAAQFAGDTLSKQDGMHVQSVMLQSTVWLDLPCGYHLALCCHRLAAVATSMSARYYALVAGGHLGIAGLADLYKDNSVCISSVYAASPRVTSQPSVQLSHEACACWSLRSTYLCFVCSRQPIMVPKSRVAMEHNRRTLGHMCLHSLCGSGTLCVSMY